LFEHDLFRKPVTTFRDHALGFAIGLNACVFDRSAFDRNAGGFFVRRLVRGLVILTVAVLLIPYAIAPLYRFIDPVSTPMLWRWATGKRVQRVVVPLNRIAPALRLAVIVAEDGSFCRNRGVDLGAIREAMQQSDEIGEARGASTITQQTAKNLFLWEGRSFIRKGLEFPLALWLNLVLPKRRILEIYPAQSDCAQRPDSKRPGAAPRRAVSASVDRIQRVGCLRAWVLSSSLAAAILL
jgi:hypothetical protein